VFCSCVVVLPCLCGAIFLYVNGLMLVLDSACVLCNSVFVTRCRFCACVFVCFSLRICDPLWLFCRFDFIGRWCLGFITGLLRRTKIYAKNSADEDWDENKSVTAAV